MQRVLRHVARGNLMRYRRDRTRAVKVSVFVCTLLFIQAVHAQDTAKIAANHPWARFEVGSWKRVRMSHESVGADGQVEQTSVTETKTTLVEVASTGYQLNVELTVELAGKRFPAEPKRIRQGFHGETNGQSANVQPLGASELVIDGKKYPIEMRKVVINGDDQKRTTLVHYNDQVSPYVLKRVTTATDAAGDKPNYESIVEVVAVAMPYRVISDIRLVSLLKTTQKQASGASTITFEVHCDDVPGGIVAHSAKELNAQNQVVSRSTLELAEYHVVGTIVGVENTPAGRRRVFPRARNR